MGHFQIPVSWYRDETMLHLMDKNPASIGVYVMMISWSFRRFDPRSRKPISNKLRKMVYERDHCRCVTCGATDHLSLDHIIPWSLGGEDTMENLQTMCRSCNSRKGNRVDVVQGG